VTVKAVVPLVLDTVPPQPARVMAAAEMTVRASLREKEVLNIFLTSIELADVDDKVTIKNNYNLLKRQ
jgi:hypothetical protein